MAREPKKAAGIVPPSAPEPAPVETPALNPASVADLAAANYADDVPAADLAPIVAKADVVVPVAVSIDALLKAIGDNAERAEQIGVRIVGPMQGRRRAGRHFGPEAQVIPVILFGEDELRAIDGDPMLSWSIVQIAAPAADGEDEPGE